MLASSRRPFLCRLCFLFWSSHLSGLNFALGASYDSIPRVQTESPGALFVFRHGSVCSVP